ncbi:MAG: hypothetical protein JXP48_12015 [Acidobacteria bacterium]|nr:hypothetical protein [Acidobacteriota bacterium]
MPGKSPILLIDANVLIDYQKSDLAVLELAAHYVGEIHVLTAIIEEVDGLAAGDFERLGLKVDDPDVNQLLRAGRRRGPLSFGDYLCLIVAADAGFTCVTNDKSLRKACLDEGVAVMWGLELMVKLVQANSLRAAEAVNIARRIHGSNPLHIPQPLLDRFAEKVARIESTQRRK